MTSLAAPITQADELNVKHSTRRYVIFVVLISTAIIVPSLYYGVPSNIDLSNHFRFALPFADAVRGGDFYPGWLAESNGGYGDPSFRFYPPALYYLLALCQFFTGNWYSATLITFLLLSILAGLGTYFWARSMMSPEYAWLASAFYALAPYHVNQFYQASMLAEYAGCAVVPFVFGFAERIHAGGDRKTVAGFAASYALLILTHLPLAVIASLGLVVYLFARPTGKSGMQLLSRLGLGCVLGLAASSIYWVSMVSELGWIGINEAIPASLVDYRKNFLLSTFSTENMNVWWMNILAFFTLLLFSPMKFLWRERSSLLSNTTVRLVALSVFMTVPLSWPIWRLLPVMQQVQFPWRWLALVSAAGSVLTALGLSRLQGRTVTRPTKLLLSGALLVSIAFTLSHSVREAQYLNAHQFAELLTSVRGTASVNYWIPKWAKPAPRPMKEAVEVGDRTVSIARWQPEQRQFSVSPGETTYARVRTFYYPHWRAFAGDKRLVTSADVDGALLIELPKAETTVDLTFQEPARSGYSAGLTSFACLLILAVALPFKWKARQ
jgi:hypothetical protein